MFENDMIEDDCMDQFLLSGSLNAKNLSVF